MATQSKIARLSARIDALAIRRWGKLTFDSLTDQAWDKLEQRFERLRAEIAPSGEPIQKRDYSQWSDDALLRALIDAGTLTPADFKKIASTES